jgi:hypothetical protein
MASLRKVSAPGYLDTRLDNLSDALATEEKIIQSEFPFWQFDREILEHNRQHILALLLPQRSVLAYFQGIGDGNLKLKMGSAQPLPVIPTALVVDTMRVEISGTHVLPGRSKPGLPTYRTVDIALPAHIEWVDAMASNLRLEFRLPGSDEKRLERVFPWLHEILHAHPRSLGLDPKPLADYDFIHIDEEHRTITLKTGAWTLDGSLTIPPGYDVIGEPGMILTMGDSAKILSRSALQLIGTESQPIVFVSKDQSGQGLFVADTGLESKLEHVEFRRLANPSHGSLALTGAVTFYQAPVTITHCRFVEMSCEDALNIVRSPFAIAHIQFADNAGDALDIDFSEGSIRWGTFLRSGNDGIDVSGTTIDITDVVMKDIGDKGLSAGENSRVTLSRTAIHRSSIALARKDLSHVTVSNLVVRNCRIGFAAFAKKPEFGPARITATELDMEDVDIPYLIEDRSTLSVDGHLHIADRERLRETLYRVKDETD